MTITPGHHYFMKGITILAAGVLATILGYLIVYWWVFGNFRQVLNVSVLKDQIVSQSQTADVREQLKSLGYKIDESSLFHLSSPNATNYHADVLGGYEPVRTDKEEGTESYYFYDENGKAYFFKVEEDGKVHPEDFVSLIQE